ncbi:MAG: hypothetical protein ACRD6W_05335, partial [Nitrososphaerales archaeon]
MIRLLDVMFRRRSIHLAIGLLFGTSWVLLNASQWFSASASTASVVFTVGSLLAFSRWLRTGLRRYYASSVVAAVVAVLFWETALAIPGFLVLLWLCFERDRVRVPRVAMGLLAFIAVSLAYLSYVQTQPWH